MAKKKLTKLIEIEIKGRSGFSGKKVTFKKFIKPPQFLSVKKETKRMGKGFGVRKTGKTKKTRFGFLHD